MYNIATIYRFNTPFLDLSTEKDKLFSVIKKIKKSIEFDWIWYTKTTTEQWLYYKVSYNLKNNLWNIDLFYISDLNLNRYHLPIFKLNIFLNKSFLLTNNSKKKTVKFLNNIFECFDWLNEKEFLIDLDSTLYYKESIFSSKSRPSYDFSDIEKIRKNFENQDWIKKVEEFIKKFSNSDFILTYAKSDYFHKLHSIFLYYIYLVFLMYQNMEKTTNAKRELDNAVTSWVYEEQIDLMKKRLLYVEEQHQNAFNAYKNRLELFFKMF